MFKAFQMLKPEVRNPLKMSGQEDFAMAVFLRTLTLPLPA